MNAAGRQQPGEGPDSAAGVPESQALEKEIRQTRQQLGETVAELAARVDVKARAKDKAGQVTSRLKASAGQAGAWATAQAGGVRGGVQPLRRATGRAVGAARQEPVLLAVAGGSMAVAIVLLVWDARQ